MAEAAIRADASQAEVKGLGSELERLRAELERLRAELEEQRRLAGDKERQLERYAADLRETFKAERARTDELHASYVGTVRALTNAVEARDAYTGKHAERVAAYGLELTQEVAPELAQDPQVEFGFLLHDIGKVAIPDYILFKGEPLLPEERALMRRHSVIGYEIVSAVPFLRDASVIVRHHHERWDGSGYPDGLAGQDIPLLARIFAVVDALDAMTTDRPYSPQTSLERARSEIAAKGGTQFDPDVVAALAKLPDATLEQIKASIA
jgi:HD-GYP domain-containing protein (c-di-GMP phosphodiesterase class II)